MDENPSRRYEPDYDIQPPLRAPASVPELPGTGEIPRSVQENAARQTGYDERGEERPLHPAPNGASMNGGGAKAKEPAALFWHQPISSEEEVNWFVPPLPRREEQGGQVLGLLEKLSAMMPNLPMRAWLMQWNYHTRAAAAAAEQVDVERESERRFAEQCARDEKDAEKLTPLIEALENRERETEAELKAAQKQFAEAAAKAGLAVEPRSKHLPASPASGSRFPDLRATGLSGKAAAAPSTAPDPITDLHYAPSGINPQCVEEALQNEVPDLDSVAGEQGVSPIPRGTLWSTILTFFMQFLAPLVCGFMLALCLGTLVGILDLDDFSRRDSMPKFILSAALGFVIVYLMGELFSNAVHSLTRTLEMRGEEEAAITASAGAGEEYSEAGRGVTARATRRLTPPGLNFGMRIAIGLIGVALFLGMAEVIAEGYGIRELHHQQIARRERFRNPNSNIPREEELPMPLYLIIGTLISGPYIIYKSTKSWGESDVQLREAWLLHQQRSWLDERRARPETGKAFELACQVEQLENSLYDIKIQLKRLLERRAGLQDPEPDRATQVRRKEARAAAVGEALRLQTMIEEIVDTHEPFPSQQAVPTRLPQFPREAPRNPLPGRSPAARP